MRNQLMSLVAVAALLTACDSTDDKKTVTGGFDNFPTCTDENMTSTSESASDFQKDVQTTVHFGFDQSTINAEAQTVLMQQADWLKRMPEAAALIEGHCDQRGTTEYNMALGERRAHAVKHFLVANGIEASRLETVSYGKERPVDGSENEAAYAQNRRAVTVLK